MWYPYRYLIAGRSKWEVIWFDPDVVVDPRAYFEQKLAPKLGPLAESGALVSVGAQNLCKARGRPGNDPSIAVPVHRALRNGAGADALMIAAGQQRSARGRADRRGMERVIADALVCDPRERWRMDWATVGIGQAEADVIQQLNAPKGGCSIVGSVRLMAQRHRP